MTKRLPAAFVVCARVLVGLCVLASVTVGIAPAEAAKPVRPGAAPNCGGQTIYKSTGAAWKCTFGDDFKTLDTTTWTAQQTSTSGYRNGGDCYVASANNVSVSNGELRLTSRKEADPFTCSNPYGDFTTQYTSGMVSTYSNFTQVYGRFEIRAKFPATKIAGLQAALWLYPQSVSKYGPWPASGEIDLAEYYSLYSDRVIPYIHYNSDPSDDSVTNNYCMVDDPSAYHTYVAEWTTTNIKINVDGRNCVDHAIDDVALSGSAPFDEPFFIALTQALGQGNNAFDPATTPLPATTTVDYVRAWT